MMRNHLNDTGNPRLNWTGALTLATGAAFALQLFIWFVFYPLLGYRNTTVGAAGLMTAVLAVGLIAALRLGPRRIGLGARALVEALVGVIAVHLVLLALIAVLQWTGGRAVLTPGGVRAFEAPLRTIWGRLGTGAMLSNWAITGLGEELLFAGVLYTLAYGAMRRVEGRSRSAHLGSIPTVAVLFALWHLPGYVAIALRVGSLGGMGPGLLLNFVSWLIFGAVYAVSGNLWLVAAVHATTDYPLLPAITGVPWVGMLTMALFLAAGWAAAALRDRTAAG